MITRRAIIVAAALGSAWALNACGAPQPSPSPLAKWKAGTNYTVLEAAQPTSAAAGRIEVDEVFWYGCPHCYALDPTLENWKASKAPYIDFVRVPVMWGPMHRQHAKLYYTILALGRPDLHTKIFDAIHRDNLQLTAPDDETARALQWAFLRDNGVSEKDFNAAYDSMTVAANLKRAQDFTYRYSVSGVPLIVVNGKYTTDVGQAGGPTQLIALINDLAASEKSR